MNEDLPQFDAHEPNGWAEITSAYDLAPLAHHIPVAIQVLRPTGRSLITGLISSTEDTFDGESEEPVRSIIYFVQAEPLHIEWSKVSGVLAMAGIPPQEEAGEP